MRRAAAMAILLLPLLLVLTLPGIAHKGATAKFTYNADVHSIFLNRCSRCHIEGGVGPMSLLKYEEAFPWAESLRTELLSAYGELSSEARAKVDLHDFVKAAHRQITARELDIVLDWATGGTPEGDKAQTPPETTLRIEWAGGPPDLIAKMPDRYHMNVTAMEATYEAAMPIQTPSPVTVARIDLLPGNPAIVRSAVLSLRLLDGTTQLIATWVPRQVPGPIAIKPHVRIDSGAHIVARIHYKKTWKYEGQPMSDLSLVGLYFAN
jgi:hypothetical protein